MRADTRSAVLADEREKTLALVRVRRREHSAARCQPLDARHRVQALSTLFPAGGVRAPEAVQQFLGLSQRQVGTEDLDVQHHDVDVVEEVKVDVRDVKDQRRLAGARRQPHRRHIVPAEYPHRRRARPVRAVILATRIFMLLAALAVQKALHVGQEGHELVVVALLELRRIAGEFIEYLMPRAVRAAGLENFPVALDLAAGVQRQQLQRPQQNLPELPHARDFTARLAEHGRTLEKGGRRQSMPGRRRSPSAAKVGAVIEL